MPTPHTNEGQTMTAEDKMRKAALTIYGDTPVSQVEKDAFKNGWQACAAQSAETIARLEEENRRLKDVVINQTIYSAAAQLDNERLRDALKSAKATIKGREHTGFIDEALAKPLDTSALDAYVASRMESYDQGHQTAVDFLHQKIAELQAKVDALKWQPIETAPKDGTAFLGYQKLQSGHWIIAPMYHVEGVIRLVQFHSDNNEHAMHPTHWMPLPPSPNTQGVE